MVATCLCVYSIYKVILVIQIYSLDISALLSKSNTIADRRRPVSRLWCRSSWCLRPFTNRNMLLSWEQLFVECIGHAGLSTAILVAKVSFRQKLCLVKQYTMISTSLKKFINPSVTVVSTTTYAGVLLLK